MEKNFKLTSLTADNLGIGLFRYELAPAAKFTSANSALLQILGYPECKTGQR